MVKQRSLSGRQDAGVRARSILPQRLRVEVPSIRNDPRRAAGLAAALRRLDGVTQASVNAVTGRALLVFGAPIRDLDAVLARVAEAGACAEPLSTTGSERRANGPIRPDRSGAPAVAGAGEQPIRRDWMRVIAGGITAGGLLLIRLFGGPLAPSFPPVAVFATGAAILVGLPTFARGLKPLLRFQAPEIDTLITTATLASLLLGEAITGLVVVWLIALGELVEEMTLDRTRRAIADLLSVGEEWVWIVTGDGEGAQEVRVRLEQVQPGDRVMVHAGDKIPVDGTVLRGFASVNQAPITGESLPVFRNPGDTVYAGTLVESGSLLIEATRVGADTAIGRIIRLVEGAREVQAPIQRLADRFSRRTVPLSFALAGIVFLLTRNVLRSMTILVIACPCAAGLATPTAVSAAIARAARRGILIKGGLYLELAGTLDAVVFDKTGTLTTGAPRVTRVLAISDRYTPERVLALAASGELHSQHPLAAAVLQHTAQREIEIPPHSDYEIIVGHGVRFAVDGTPLVIGSRHMLDDFGIPVSPGAERAARRMRERGETVLWVAEAAVDVRRLSGEHEVRRHPNGERPASSAPSKTGRQAAATLPAGDGADGESAGAPAPGTGRSEVIGLIGVADVLRPEAIEAVQALRDAGVRRVCLITGDTPESAAVIAEQLGISPQDVTAEALPEVKFDLVRRLQQEGYRVALVGDGINDAPALAAADVGIAMGHGGADVALEAADIALAADDVRHVAEVIRLSRRTMRLVRQNFAASLGINGIGVVAGALGLISPFAAALLHNLSTVAVVLNSGRLLTAPNGGAPAGALPPPADVPSGAE
jgi:cation-transporting P-type ATPase C